MAKRKKRRSSRTTRSKQKQSFPGWLWMIFGLAIGLSVALAVYMRDHQPATAVATNKPAPAEAVVDSNGEAGRSDEQQAPVEERRFTFYELLPNFVVEIPDQEPEKAADVAPQAVTEPGVYVLQAGSFSTEKDAERRRAELGLLGIASKIQRVKINDKNYFRVFVGPTDDLDQVNMLRSRLRAAKIDVFRIRLSD